MKTEGKTLIVSFDAEYEQTTQVWEYRLRFSWSTDEAIDPMRGGAGDRSGLLLRQMILYGEKMRGGRPRNPSNEVQHRLLAEFKETGWTRVVIRIDLGDLRFESFSCGVAERQPPLSESPVMRGRIGRNRPRGPWEGGRDIPIGLRPIPGLL